MDDNFVGKLFVFSAPSGSGKTTIVRHLLQQEKCIYIYIHINNLIENNFKIEFFSEVRLCVHIVSTMYSVQCTLLCTQTVQCTVYS